MSASERPVSADSDAGVFQPGDKVKHTVRGTTATVLWMVGPWIRVRPDHAPARVDEWPSRFTTRITPPGQVTP